MIEFLMMLVIILLVTKLADHFCARIRIPAVIGELLMGILIGPAVLNWVRPTDSVELFAEIGIILLMFLAGLESDLALLKKYFSGAVKVAVLGILFPCVVLSGFSLLLHLSLNESLFIGILFSATSVSISVQVLREYKKMQSTEGTVILGAAVLDDILVVLLVSFFLAFVSGNTSQSIGISFIANLVLPKLLFFVLFYLFAKFLFNPARKLVKRLVIFESEFSFALICCLIFSVLAEELGLSNVLGSFFVGVLFSTTSDQKKILLKTESMGSAFFIPVFFVSIGLMIDLSVLKNSLLVIFLFTLLAFLTKLIGGFLGAKWDGLNNQESMLIGTGIVSRGEMALIIAQMGYAGHLVSDQYFSILLFAIILTTLMAPFAMKYAMRQTT